MVLDFFRRGSESSLERIEQSVKEMLADNDTTFGMATDAMFGRVDPGGIGKKLRESDRQVNRGERAVRRELMVHAGVAGAEDEAMWADRFERTQELINETATIFSERDAQNAASRLSQMDEWTTEFDDEISALVREGGSAGPAVPRALLNRYLKRITAHLMNVMTAVVMPLDRLDYWDEDKVDRVD